MTLTVAGTRHGDMAGAVNGVSIRRRARSLASVLLAVAAAGCVRHAAPVEGADQLVVVVTADWDASRGTLYMFERRAGWHRVGPPAAVTVGRAGAAWGDGMHPRMDGVQKREGDGRAPAGVFALGPAFGDVPRLPIRWPYNAMTATHVCIDVPSSPFYNRIVDARVVGAHAVAGATEPMRRDLLRTPDDRYRRGLVIEHNANARAGHGSCIFAHVWQAPDVPTAGCTAMSRATIERLLAWLEPARSPRFVLLPAPTYERLRSAWHLPRLDSAATIRSQGAPQ